MSNGIPDHLRCDALTNVTWKGCNHRCEHTGRSFRDGRWVCAQHADMPGVSYACGNRFEAFGKVMARALGDEVPGEKSDSASLSGIIDDCLAMAEQVHNGETEAVRSVALTATKNKLRTIQRELAKLARATSETTE